MKHWTKHLFALAAPLLLAGCLWTPGKFASDLTLRKDGTFALDYRGQIILVTADAANSQPWTAGIAHCQSSGKDRPCSAAEIAEQKDAFDKKRQSDAEMAKTLGLPGADDQS